MFDLKHAATPRGNPAEMMESIIRLFDGKDVAAVYRGPPPGPEISAKPLIVTFAPRSRRNDINRPGFGHKFLPKYDYPAVYVKVSRNHWYQTAEMEAVLDGICDLARHFNGVVTYGSSMGGYAALLFGPRLGAVAVALSPLYAIDPEVMPDETRWREDLAQIDDYLYPSKLMAGGRGYILYDPFSSDHAHVERISADAPVTVLPVRLSGHPTSQFLAEIGLLSSLVRHMFDGSDPAPVLRGVREGRRQSWRYWLELAKRSRQHNHKRLAAEAMRRATEIAPDRRPVKRQAARLDKKTRSRDD